MSFYSEHHNSMQSLNHLPSNLTLPRWHNITFLLNVSRDIPEKLGIALFGYALPVVLLLTLITSLMIVLVLWQPNMRSSTNLVLLGMALSDLFTLMLPSPWYIYLYSLGHYNEAIYPISKCYLFHWMYEVLPALFHTYSIWLTVLLASQRYVYVCHFSLARTWCTMPQVMRAMMFLLSIAILHQSTRFFDRVFVRVQFIANDDQVEGCEYFTAHWVETYFGEDVYYIFYYTFRIFFVHIGPCVALVLLNVLLVRVLHKTKKTRQRLFGASESSYHQTDASNLRRISLMAAKTENDQSNWKSTREETTTILHDMKHTVMIDRESSQPTMVVNSRLDSRSTTAMLIVIVSVFLILEIPLTLTTILHVVQNAASIELVNYNVLNTVILITNFFIIISHPVNFAIYCGMSRQFRQTFNQIILSPMMNCFWRKWTVFFHTDHTMTVFQQEQNASAQHAITGASSSTFAVTSRSNAVTNGQHTLEPSTVVPLQHRLERILTKELIFPTDTNDENDADGKFGSVDKSEPVILETNL